MQTSTSWVLSINPEEAAITSYDRTIPVEVCYQNLCNGMRTCNSFEINLKGIADNVPMRVVLNETESAVKKSIIYPNPNNGQFTVKLPNVTSGNYQISDKNGRIVCKSEFVKTDNLEILITDRQYSGWYIIKIDTGKESFAEKIIINK